MPSPRPEDFLPGRVLWWNAKPTCTTNGTAVTSSTCGARNHAVLLLEIRTIPGMGLVATQALYITSQDHHDRNRVQIRDSTDTQQHHLQFNRLWTRKPSFLMCESAPHVPLRETSYVWNDSTPIHLVKDDWTKILAQFPSMSYLQMNFSTAPTTPSSSPRKAFNANKNRRGNGTKRAHQHQPTILNGDITGNAATLSKTYGISLEPWMLAATITEIESYAKFYRGLQSFNQVYDDDLGNGGTKTVERFLETIGVSQRP